MTKKLLKYQLRGGAFFVMLIFSFYLMSALFFKYTGIFSLIFLGLALYMARSYYNNVLNPSAYLVRLVAVTSWQVHLAHCLALALVAGAIGLVQLVVFTGSYSYKLGLEPFGMLLHQGDIRNLILLKVFMAFFLYLGLGLFFSLVFSLMVLLMKKVKAPLRYLVYILVPIGLRNLDLFYRPSLQNGPIFSSSQMGLIDPALYRPEILAYIRSNMVIYLDLGRTIYLGLDRFLILVLLMLGMFLLNYFILTRLEEVE